MAFAESRVLVTMARSRCHLRRRVRGISFHHMRVHSITITKQGTYWRRVKWPKAQMSAEQTQDATCGWARSAGEAVRVCEDKSRKKYLSSRSILKSQLSFPLCASVLDCMRSSGRAVTTLNPRWHGSTVLDLDLSLERTPSPISMTVI